MADYRNPRDFYGNSYRADNRDRDYRDDWDRRRNRNDDNFRGAYDRDSEYAQEDRMNYRRGQSGYYGTNDEMNFGESNRNYGSGRYYERGANYRDYGAKRHGMGPAYEEGNYGNYGRDNDEGFNIGNYGNRESRYGRSQGSRYGDPRMDRETNRYSDRGYFHQNIGRRHYGPLDDYNRNDRDWWDKTTDEVSSWFGDDEAKRRREIDRLENHRGRGPRNYKRSDSRITEDINDRLSDDYYVDASDVEIDVQNGEVTLKGKVNSRQEKRRAEDIVESVSGVVHCENRIRVGDYASTTSPTISSGTSRKNTGTENNIKTKQNQL